MDNLPDGTSFEEAFRGRYTHALQVLNARPIIGGHVIAGTEVVMHYNNAEMRLIATDRMDNAGNVYYTTTFYKDGHLDRSRSAVLNLANINTLSDSTVNYAMNALNALGTTADSSAAPNAAPAPAPEATATTAPPAPAPVAELIDTHEAGAHLRNFHYSRRPAGNNPEQREIVDALHEGHGAHINVGDTGTSFYVRPVNGPSPSYELLRRDGAVTTTDGSYNFTPVGTYNSPDEAANAAIGAAGSAQDAALAAENAARDARRAHNPSLVVITGGCSGRFCYPGIYREYPPTIYGNGQRRNHSPGRAGNW